MLSRLIEASIRGRVVVLAFAVVLLVIGARRLPHAPLDVFPEFAPPKVEVQTEAPGLSTEEVESLVTMPLEGALNGTPNLKTLRSKSVLGLSSVVKLFEEGTDLHKARQYVQERVQAEAARMPGVVLPPVILQPLSSLSRVMKIGVSSKTLSQMELTDLALWTIRPKLMSVPGVANVAIWGQRDRQLQVLVNPDKLRAANVSLDQVVRAAGDAVTLESGGFIDTPNQRIAVRQVAPVLEPDDLQRTIVDFRAGAPIRLGDVARVVVGSPPPIGNAIINDGPGLLLIVEKQPEGNTLDVTRRLDAALEELTPALKDVQVDPTIVRPASFVVRALENLRHALLFGCGLVVAILVLFLFDWRSALISIIAIPLSLVAAILALTWLGTTVNTMVLAGLAIALGEVVDDAIIDVENIVRRLRENRQKNLGRSAFSIVLSASMEVRGAVVYATMIVALVFLPVFFLEGLAGSFFRPLAAAYILAILASLLVALTVTPALSYFLFAGRRRLPEESPLTRFLKAGYSRLLPLLLNRPYAALAIAGASFLLAGATATRLGSEFLPEFQETDFLMHFLERPGASIDSMDRMTIRASKELRAIPGVRNFGSHIGRADVADEVVGPNFTELWISVDPEVDYPKTLKEIQTAMNGYAGMYVDVQTYLKERSKEVLSGAGASIVVRLFGPDMNVLRSKAKDVENAMSSVSGVVNLKVESQVLVPQIEVRLRPGDAQRNGVTAAHVRRATTTLLRGQKVGDVFEQDRRFAVVVWGDPNTRADLRAIRDLPIDAPSGAQLRVRDVADVIRTSMPNEIKREAASRRLDVTCNVQGRDLGSAAREIESKVKELSFDRGYRPEFLGEYAAQQESTRRLYQLAGLALLGILLVLHADFGSWRLVAVTAATLPFALVGGVAAVALTSGVVSLGTVVGFVTVLGIAARNGIMLVGHYRHLEDVEGEPFGPGLVTRGSLERLSPILMTALATGLALLPLALAGHRPGQEIEHPLAVVILGGLVTSTILNLFLLPPLCLRFGRRTEAERSLDV